MEHATSLEDKVTLARARFGGLIGQRITGYELAELWSEPDQAWSPWRDLPVILTFESGDSLSIWWSNFDELGLAGGRVLPFSLSGCTVRWVSEGSAELDQAVGLAIESVALANDEMSMERTVEIWIHLCLRLSSGGTLNIYNALDETGVEYIRGKIRADDRTIALRIEECV